MLKITREVEQFIADPSYRNKWLRASEMSVYVRRARHYNPDGILTETLDLANVVSFKPGRGRFTRFLNELEKISPWVIYIESVENERLIPFLMARGYLPIPGRIPPSFFKALH